MEIIYEKKPKELIEDFLIDYHRVFNNIDIDKARKIIIDTIAYYKDGIETKNCYSINLSDRWYRSLKKEKTDYGIYGDEYYFTDLWACWIIYSRKYLRSFLKSTLQYKQKEFIIFDYLKSSKSIVDLGCGIGLTTSALSQMFKKSKIYGTNIKGTDQYIFCSKMAKKYGFTIVSDIKKLKGGIDTAIAFEYFEHIETPIEHIEEIIKMLKPKNIVFANSFNTRSVGHFKRYKNNGMSIDQRDVSKLFNSVLMSRGYFKMKTNMWNNRPMIWSNIK